MGRESHFPPSVLNYYAISRIATVTFAICLIGISESVPAWFALLCLVVCLPALRPNYPQAKSWLGLALPWRVLVVLGGLGLGTIAYRETGDIVSLVIPPLGLFLPLALTHPKRELGHWYSILCLFLMSLIALIAGNGIAEYLLFFVFSAAAVFFLNAGHLYFHLGPHEAARQRVPESYFLAFIVSVGLGWIVGVLLFILFPRSISWYNPLGLRGGEKVSGYSGTVVLEGAGPSESGALAMMVDSPDADWLAVALPELYFRGNTLDFFDGIRWKSTLTREHPFSSPMALEFTDAIEPQVKELKIYREAHTTPAVLYPGVLRGIQVPTHLLGPLVYDDSGTLLRSRTESMRYSYDVVVSPLALPRTLSKLTLKDLREQIGDELDFSLEYLQMPETVRHAAWFQKWARETVPDRPEMSVGELLGGLGGEFRTHFKTTILSADSSRKGLEAFLTTERKGHCEYFASAAAMALRLRGVPTRVALGYRGGQFNPVSRVGEVRESNAHAWLEVLVPGTGWVTFDPTPFEISPSPVGVLARLKLWKTAFKYWMQRYVIDYNGTTQRELFRDLSARRPWPVRGEKIDWDVVKRWFLVLATAFLLYRRSTRRRRRRLKKEKQDLPPYYRAFLKRLHRWGIERKRGETYSRFHARLSSGAVPRALLDEIDRTLEQDLYSARPVSSDRRRRLERRIRSEL